MIDHRLMIHKAVKEMDQGYNQQLKLYGSRFYPSRFHCSLEDIETVHHTRESLLYVLALLSSGEELNTERAIEILTQVLSMQDKDRNSETFGIWPWYYEEPLHKMRRPDFNWADFCGKLLLLICRYFEDVLPAQLKMELRESILFACESIVKRGIGPNYTNICIMDCLVTILAGEYYHIDSLLEYGLEKLEVFYRYTKKINGFEEYNSPTYQRVSINELSCILQCSNDERAKKISKELLDVAWRTVAQHFHVPTKQWGGPHGRCYNTIGDNEMLSFIQVGTDGQIRFLPEEEGYYYPGWYHGRIHCPEKYIHYLADVSERTIVDLIEDKEGVRKHAKFYMNQDVCLGTFDKNIMWGHNRAFIAYIQNQELPSYIHMQYLLNGEGFCSAVLTTAQIGFNSLIGINFANDYGTVHLNFDPTNGKVAIKDMRLRFEIGGNLSNVKVEYIETSTTDKGELALFRTCIGTHVFYIQNLFIDFDGMKPTWQIHRDENRIYLDYIFYIGEEINLDFSMIRNAVLLLSFTSEEPKTDFHCRIQEKEESIEARYTRENSGMRICVRRMPKGINNLFLQNETEQWG